MNPETIQDLADRSYSDAAVVPDAPPAQPWMGVIGLTEPVPPVDVTVLESEA